MSARLEIENVFTAYDRADVLDGVTLTVAPGRITCLLGGALVVTAAPSGQQEPAQVGTDKAASDNASAAARASSSISQRDGVCIPTCSVSERAPAQGLAFGADRRAVRMTALIDLIHTWSRLRTFKQSLGTNEISPFACTRRKLDPSSRSPPR